MVPGITLNTGGPLLANGVYEQPVQDRFQQRPVGAVRGLVWADKAGTLYLEHRDTDSGSWAVLATVAVSANTTTELPWTNLSRRYYRFRYVNGAAAQEVVMVLIQRVADAEQAVQLTGSSVEVASAVTPHDANDLANPTIAIYLGTDGDLKVDLVGGSTVTFKNLSGGVFHPIRATRVYNTGTTATDIVGVY